MKMDLSKIKTFHAVAVHKSFLNAAHHLNITQPCLSRTVKLLEEELGVILFERHAKGVRLTPQGLRTFEWASKMLEEASVFERLIKDHTDEPMGELKIGTTPAAAYCISHFMPEFLKKYPKIKLNIMGSMDKINLNEVDVIMTSCPPKNCPTEHIFLTRYTMKLYASQEYINDYGLPRTIEDLSRHKFIKYADERMREISDIDYISHVGALPWEERASIVKISPADALLHAAELGVGIVELADCYKSLKKPTLIELPIEGEYPRHDLLYIYRIESASSKRITLFGDFLKEKFSQMR